MIPYNEKLIPTWVRRPSFRLLEFRGFVCEAEEQAFLIKVNEITSRSQAYGLQ